MSVRPTRLQEVRDWNRSLLRLRDEMSCAHPGFFKPYHFVTMALMLKAERAGALQLPEGYVEYAARMKLWEAIGLPSPAMALPAAGGTRYHPLTRLVDLDSVDGVSSALTKVVLANSARAANDDTSDSLAITLSELIGNCYHHARADQDLHGLVCAQTWWRDQRAQFAIADSGIGIRNSLMENASLIRRLKRENACALATKLGVSSKLNQNHQGYGLALVRDLARMTPGAMLIVQSGHEAVVVQGKSVAEFNDFENAIPGTLIIFEWDVQKPLDVAAVYESWPKAENGDDFF